VILSGTAARNCGMSAASGADFRKSRRCIGDEYTSPAFCKTKSTVISGL
jgi:hypothetical protein